MCDYAVGLSRQLSGSIIPSERKLIHLLIANLNGSINYKNLYDS